MLKLTTTNLIFGLSAALQAFMKWPTRNPHVLYVHSGFCVPCALHPFPNIKFAEATLAKYGFIHE